jgi:hypothetical protein
VQEHLHLHPDRLVMQEDLHYRLEEMLQEKPFFRALPADFFSTLNGRSAARTDTENIPDAQEVLDHLSYNMSWHSHLEWMRKLKAREQRRKARGDYYKPYIDVDDIDLALTEDKYRYYEDLSPDDQDFQKGPDRQMDADFLRRAREFRFIHDRPHIEGYIQELEEARARMRTRDPACVSAVDEYNERGRQLQAAARCGHLDRIRELVAAGVPVNFQDMVRSDCSDPLGSTAIVSAGCSLPGTRPCDALCSPSCPPARLPT